MILGIDEVGRGPWAGPLVIGAVVLGGASIEGLTDSKKLSKKRRVELDILIREHASGFGLGWVTAAEIDDIGLSESLRLATRRAVEQVKTPFHEIIIDGTINFLSDTPLSDYVKTMPKADLLVPSVSAASIIGKVARDTYMEAQDAVYSGYKFGSHVGYGTAAHRAAINELGVTPLHRLSFAPLQKYQTTPSSELVPKNNKSGSIKGISGKIRSYVGVTSSSSHHPIDTRETTKKIGDHAEDEAANYLVRSGHEILERNWKTKYCEIDIVSVKNGTFYFTEVKYRKNPDQGGGMAAITRKKYNQMQFAARLYVQTKQIKNVDLLLAACSMTGEVPGVEEFIELK